MLPRLNTFQKIAQVEGVVERGLKISLKRVGAVFEAALAVFLFYNEVRGNPVSIAINVYIDMALKAMQIMHLQKEGQTNLSYIFSCLLTPDPKII